MANSANGAAAVDASAVIQAPTHTDFHKVSVARDVVSLAQKHPGWATAADLQSASTAWTNAANALEANATLMVQLKSQLRSAAAKQRSSRRDWRAARKQVLGAVDVLSAGSADEIKAFGFGVRSRSPNGKPVSVPTEVSSKPGKALGEVFFSWPRGASRYGFVVQTAVDVANPATLSAVIPCTTTKYTAKPGSPGALVYFRVAAIDPSSPTGQTAWCAWVSGTAR